MSKVNKRSTWNTVISIALMCDWVVVSVIAVQLVVGYLMIFILGAERFNKPVWVAVYSAVSYTIALALVIIVPLLLKQKYVRKKSPKKPGSKSDESKSKRSDLVKRKLLRSEMRMELGLSGLPTWTDIGLSPIGFIASLFLAAGLVGLFSSFPWFNVNEVQDVGFSVYMSSGDRIIAFLTLVVMAPIAEEIIFRGWLYGKIRERLTGQVSEVVGTIISILIVSVLFGLVHLQWNVGVNVFALSVVLCVLREITGTIYAGILTHMY